MKSMPQVGASVFSHPSSHLLSSLPLFLSFLLPSFLSDCFHFHRFKISLYFEFRDYFTLRLLSQFLVHLLSTTMYLKMFIFIYLRERDRIWMNIFCPWFITHVLASSRNVPDEVRNSELKTPPASYLLAAETNAVTPALAIYLLGALV